MISVSALPCKTANMEIRPTSFHLNVACCFANKHETRQNNHLVTDRLSFTQLYAPNKTKRGHKASRASSHLICTHSAFIMFATISSTMSIFFDYTWKVNGQITLSLRYFTTVVSQQWNMKRNKRMTFILTGGRVVCLLANQHTKFKWKDVISLFPVLQGSKKVKGKVFPYSLPSVGPGADPGIQPVSPQVTWSESR